MGRTSGHFIEFSGLMENDGACPDLNACSDDPYVIIHTAAVVRESPAVPPYHKEAFLYQLCSLCIAGI